MFSYTIYRIETGEIVPGRTGHCTDYRDVVAQPIGPGELCYDGFYEAHEWYFELGQPTPRPRLYAGNAVDLAPDGTTAFQLTGVPAETRARFQGVWHDVDDGEIVLVVSVAGIYELLLEPPFPFQRQAIRINADAL